MFERGQLGEPLAEEEQREALKHVIAAQTALHVVTLTLLTFLPLPSYSEVFLFYLILFHLERGGREEGRRS